MTMNEILSIVIPLLIGAVLVIFTAWVIRRIWRKDHKSLPA